MQITPYTSNSGDGLKMHNFVKEMDNTVEFLAKNHEI